MGRGDSVSKCGVLVKRLGVALNNVKSSTNAGVHVEPFKRSSCMPGVLNKSSAVSVGVGVRCGVVICVVGDRALPGG